MDGLLGILPDETLAAPLAALAAISPHVTNTRLTNGYRPPSQEGEAALGIAQFDCCAVASFSGTINAMGDYLINSAHVNGRQPGQGLGQPIIYMMTHIPVSHPENLKPLIKTSIKLLTEEDQFDDEYAGLRFCLAPSKSGNGGYLLLGLSPASVTHMRLRDILMTQRDAAHDSTYGPTPWYPPPYLANPN
jgi:hypothetical protein